MAMSTNISDLPGPQPEDSPEYNDNISDMQQIQQMQQINSQESFKDDLKEDTNESDSNIIYEQPSKIKMDIRKVNSLKAKDNSTLGVLYNELNEENLLILIILYISSTSLSNEYTQKLLSMISFNVNNNLIITITKCVLLLLLFIIVKLYILPNIKV